VALIAPLVPVAAAAFIAPAARARDSYPGAMAVMAYAGRGRKD
jgi:hypothetical protein